MLGIGTACCTSRTSLSKSLSLDSIDSLSLETVPSLHLTGLSSFELSSPPSGLQLDSKEVAARSDFVSSATMFVWEVHKSFDRAIPKILTDMQAGVWKDLRNIMGLHPNSFLDTLLMSGYY